MNTTKTDSELKEDVTRQLAWDPGIDAAAIGVSAHLGVVTLNGIVPCWSDKHAAEDAARRVEGVHDVANDIEIKPSWSTIKSDVDIALLVRSALEGDARLDDETICTTVSDHIVTLTGTVRTAAERDEAERVVRALEDVRFIENHLTVQAP